jgi:hypothetical protein
MSNTVKLDPAQPIRGDYGLGLCLACLRDHVAAVADAAAAKASGAAKVAMPLAQPHHAIVMAPSPVPVPGPGGTVAGVAIAVLPSCYDHLIMTRPAADSGLIVPNGPRP